MIKTLKFKLYHSGRNKNLNEQTKICGNIYNHCIAIKHRYYKMYGKSLNKFRLQKHLAKLKKLDKYSFWKKVDAQAIQDITDRIERAYKTFFDNCRKTTKTRKVSPPSFQRVRNYSSFTLKQTGYSLLSGNQVRIREKIYKYHKSRDVGGKIKCVTVKRDNLDDWYVYFVCEIESDQELISMTGKTAGFDFGCTTLLTLHDGTEIKSPLFFKKSRKQIARANKALSSKVKGSNNRKKAKLVLARVHKSVSNRRRDFHFKLANSLCKTYDTMFFETLDIRSMMKEHGRKINDLGFSDFMKILEFKSLEHGKVVHCIDKWYASSKLCSCCGFKNVDLHKWDKSWTCPICGTHHNRDKNASKNILFKGLDDLSQSPVRSLTVKLEDVILDVSQVVFVNA